MLSVILEYRESIKVGQDITITLMKVEGEKVRIGIDAPKHIKIYREELYHQIKSDKNSDVTGLENQNHHHLTPERDTNKTR